MQNLSISRILVVVLGLMFSLYIVIESITSRTSILGKLYLFVAIGALLLGMFRPKSAIFALLVCTGYIDFFKRLTVIASEPTNFDVACTLATPPLLCGGCIINLVLSVVMSRIRVTKSIVYSFIFACLVLIATFLTNTGEGIRGLGSMVNYAAYPFLLVIIPVYFSSMEDKIKLMKFIYVLFIGVALYMIKHGIYGLADFEYDYLLTNLSLESRILGGSSIMRCFSTMNGAGIVSTMCGLMFFWSFANVWRRNLLNTILFFLCATIFLVAAYYTLSRTGWICGLVSLVSYILFLNWKTTITAYIGGLGVVIMLVVCSPIIKDMNLVSQAEQILKSTLNASDRRTNQVTTLGSFNGRIEGWVNLMTKEDMWTPFGWKIANKRGSSHEKGIMGDDIIYWYIITYGYVPVFTGLALFLIFMYRLHRFVCGLPYQSMERKISTICLATAVGILSGGLSNAAQLNVFPINIYFFFCLSVVYSIYMQRVVLKKSSTEPIKNIDYVKGKMARA